VGKELAARESHQVSRWADKSIFGIQACKEVIVRFIEGPIRLVPGGLITVEFLE
jgi:hypothetical protein